MPTSERTRPGRVHVWAPVAFAHLRAYRCGVFIDESEPGNDALCDRPPLNVAEFQALLPSGRGPLAALCEGHSVDALSWPSVVSVVPLRDHVEG